MLRIKILHGGGGSHQNLVDSKPIYDELWASGAMPPMVLASASVSPLGFYLDHSGGRVTDIAAASDRLFLFRLGSGFLCSSHVHCAEVAPRHCVFGALTRR